LKRALSLSKGRIAVRQAARIVNSAVDSALALAYWQETGSVSQPTSRIRSQLPLKHPQLVPYARVIQRAKDEVQVGIDPDTALVFRGEGFGALLTQLDGSQPSSGVRSVALAAGLTTPQIASALDALSAAGLLTERGLTPYSDGLIGLQIRLIGAGPVGYQIARVLVASGLGTLYAHDDEPPDPSLYPTAGVLTSRAEALRSVLAKAGTTISTVSHWSKPEAAPLDLTIVACDHPELDRVITDHLVRTDQPHLVVRCWGNGVSVGPLVVAGQTSCLCCADLTRRDADPQWPVVLGQLSRLRIESPPALRAWAASVAAAQALAFLNGELPESAGATLELSWPDFVTRLRRWPAHPSCGCGWPSHTEWWP
jgi:hypothetical protein